MGSIVIGIAGTAKNTGKTTTTSAIMNEVKEDARLNLGLTSIGYDGEDIDNITGLPKPRIQVWSGVIIAVAEQCIKHSTAKIEVLMRTKVKTPLGTIIIGRVKQKGKLVVAGPNKSKELAEILNLMRNYQTNFIIVDGALNRIAPMVEVDGLILTTGAARTTNINKLATETKKIVEILSYPVLDAKGQTISTNCILDKKNVDKMLDDLQKNDTIDIKGIIGENSLKYFIEKYQNVGEKRLIFSDMIKLLVCGEINQIYSQLAKLKELEIDVGVKKSINIIAVTINPYYPQYRFSNDNYQVAYVDREEMEKQFKENLPIKVYDVVKDGGHNLLQDILEFWNCSKSLAGK